MSTTDVVMVSGARTPIGRFGGALRPLTAVELGATAIKAAVQRAGIEPGAVDEVIVGHARQAGCGPNPGRLAALKAGLPESAPASTIQQACVSSMKALLLAYQSIVLGDAEVVVVGGMEHMSNIPFYNFDLRWGNKMGDVKDVDGMYRDGFIDPLKGQHMGSLAEAWADRYGISRAEQDAYALRSQQNTEAARLSGFTPRMIAPVTLPGKGKGEPVVVDSDEHPRADTSLEKLAKLPPAFRPDGTVTAGNASGISDGAVAAVVMSARRAQQLACKPIARLLGGNVTAIQPEDYGLAPAPSIRKALKRYDLSLDQVDLFEINEAFAVQVLGVTRELEMGIDRVNLYGSGIALGHPIGMSGLRVAVYAALGLQERSGRYAVASLCGNGGHGGTVVLERA